VLKTLHVGMKQFIPVPSVLPFILSRGKSVWNLWWT